MHGMKIKTICNAVLLLWYTSHGHLLKVHRSVVLDLHVKVHTGGVFGVSRPPLQKYIKEAKRVMYWYKKHTKMLEISVISAHYIIKQPIFSKGLHPPHPLLHIWLNTSLHLLKYTISMILVL